MKGAEGRLALPHGTLHQAARDAIRGQGARKALQRAQGGQLGGRIFPHNGEGLAGGAVSAANEAIGIRGVG